MKPVLLGLSLTANAVLLAGVAYLALARGPDRPVDRPEDPTRTASAKVSSSGPEVRPVAPKPFPVTIPMTGSWQSPADVHAWLLACHAPPKVRLAAAQYVLMKRDAAAFEAMRFPAGVQKWQRGHTRSTPELRNQQSAFWRRQHEELSALLGADYPRARYDEAAAARAGLSIEKFAAVERLRQDNMEIRMLQNRNWSSGTQELLDKEMAADLAGILTPEELELHQVYESSDAQRVQGWMRGLDVDDETYLRVFRAAARTMTPSGIPEAGLQALEKAVGPEIARHIAMSQDDSFSEFNHVYSEANLSPATRFEKYEAWKEFRGTLDRLQSAHAPRGNLDENQQTLLRSAYDRLTAGLPPAARARFDKTTTGAFMTRVLPPSQP